MSVICWVSNGNDNLISPNQRQSSYTDRRHRENMIVFVNNKECPMQPSILSIMLECAFKHDKLDEECTGWYTHGQMMDDAIYGLISYNCWLYNAFRLKLGYNLNIMLVAIRRGTGKEMTEHIVRPAKAIPRSQVKAWHVLLLSWYIDFRRFWSLWKSNGRGQ